MLIANKLWIMYLKTKAMHGYCFTPEGRDWDLSIGIANKFLCGYLGCIYNKPTSLFYLSETSRGSYLVYSYCSYIGTIKLCFIKQIHMHWIYTYLFGLLYQVFVMSIVMFSGNSSSVLKANKGCGMY